MQFRRMIPVMIVGMTLAMTCAAQNAPGGAAPGGAAPGGAAAGGGGGAALNMITLKVDGFFAQVDTNKDGNLSKEEWKAAGLQDSVFSYVNASKSGSITLQELTATKFPAAIDTDKDGSLTVAEMIAFDKTQSGGPK